MIHLVFFSIAVVLLVHYIWHRRRQHSIFKRLGVPGPRPHLLFGNQLDLAGGPSATIARWHKEYGATFGYFEGAKPILVTKDLDIIKEVYIKQFSKFSARKPLIFGPDPKKVKNDSILMAEGHRWKRHRSLLSPAFTSGKLKQTQPLMLQAINSLMEMLEVKEKDDKGFNIVPLFQAMTLDIISSTAFGLDIDAQHNQDGDIITTSRRIFAQTNMNNMKLSRKLIIYISLAFPCLKDILFSFFTFIGKLGIFHNNVQWLGDQLRNVIKEREESSERPRQDFLQNLIDAQTDEMVNDNALTMTEDGDGNETASSVLPEKPKFVRVTKKITKQEIVSNSIGFLLAGYETTSTTLCYTANELAVNPDVQAKLHEEIDEVVGLETPDYKHLSQMPYLDMVLSEASRKNTVIPLFITRMCTEITRVGNMLIPEGMSFMVSAVAIHSDPDLWGPSDPTKFDPERFSPANKAGRNPLAFQAFGAGPRNCIGMRLALMEAKLALIAILQKYNINRCEKTEDVLELHEQGALVPKNGVNISLTSRQ